MPGCLQNINQTTKGSIWGYNNKILPSLPTWPSWLQQFLQPSLCRLSICILRRTSIPENLHICLWTSWPTTSPPKVPKVTKQRCSNWSPQAQYHANPHTQLIAGKKLSSSNIPWEKCLEKDVWLVIGFDRMNKYLRDPWHLARWLKQSKFTMH